MAESFDFSGWATRNNLVCTDGRIIRKNAFIDNDSEIVPLVWQHNHNSPENIIGHAVLENRDDGVYAYGVFNDNPRGIAAKKAVMNGDLDSLSIYANHLTQEGPNVVHGVIREVSLVMHGANPGAYIDNVIQHSDGTESYGDSGIIYNDEIINTEKPYYLCHASGDEYYISENEEDSTMANYDDLDMELDAIEDALDDLDEMDELYDDAIEDVYGEDDDADDYDLDDADYNDIDDVEHGDYDDYYLYHAEDDLDDETVADVFEGMTDKQKMVVYYMVGQALENEGLSHSDFYEEDGYMKHNVFDMEDGYMAFNTSDPNALAHGDELLAEEALIFEEAAKNQRSLKDTVLMHAATYGIDDIDWLFPDPKNYTTEPEFVTRNMEWVTNFMNGTKKSPFSRIKTIFADITADAARAKGYTKGNRKIEEVFKLLKRKVSPTTVYKKQAFDRDDLLDITSFDAAAYVRKEMRVMLNEELARACLIGDGRDPVTQADDKIDEQCIVPIYTDDDLFTIKVPVVVAANDTDEAKAKKLVKAVIKARKNYKGTGNPTFYTTDDVLSDLLLVEDSIGRRLYRTKDELATALMVKEVITVPVMENVTRTDKQSVTRTLAGIIVNPIDYVVGADKGGEINTFDDFDIDFNKMKYLMETRMSGALTKPYSAMAIEWETASGNSSSNEQPSG